MEHPQEHAIQLVARPPSRGSSADAASTTTTTTTQPTNDAARLVGICPALYRAASRGRTEEVMALLLQQHAAGAAAKDRHSTGIFQHGHCDILEVSAEGNTVIHVAAEQGHHELIQELYVRFKNSIDDLVSHRNSALDTPLHCASRAGHVSAVAILVQLAQGQDYCGESILACKNEAGDTARHLAARHGHGAAAEVLVPAAPELAAELNNAGVSPLYLAVMSGSVQTVRAITTCSDASAVGPSSQNALHAAVFESSEMVDLLMEWRPALAEQVDDRSGSSPLHFASSNGGDSNDVVRAILRAAPPGTAYKKDSCGLSALHVAARMGHHRVVKEILEWCPDAAELRDNNGETFVHAAAKEKRSVAEEDGRCSVVSLATEDPTLRRLLNAQDKAGNTPLHLAVAAGAPRVVDALVRKGEARADVLNKDGHTALDRVAGTTGVLATVSLVATLAAFGAQLGPQRHDHLEPWSGRDRIARWIRKSSDSLAVAAVLIATAAFAAGFSMPGGYSEGNKDNGSTAASAAGHSDGNKDKGKANLKDNDLFKIFLFMDTLAMALSVVTVVLLVVFGKALRSATGSWKSFAFALQCMWASLICLLLAFYAAAVTTTDSVYRYYGIIYLCIIVVTLYIIYGIGLEAPFNLFASTFWRFIYHRAKSSRHCRFMCQERRCHLKGRHAVQRQYPLTCTYVLNLCVFIGIYVLGLIVFVVITNFAK